MSYRVVWPEGSIELQTEGAAIHLANSFREDGREATVYSRPSPESEWVEIRNG